MSSAITIAVVSKVSTSRVEKADADPEGCFGRRVRLEADEMPTIGIYVERLEAGQTTRSYRHSANVVFSPMMGSGSSLIGDMEIEWGRGDTFVGPTWNWIEHRAWGVKQLKVGSFSRSERMAKWNEGLRIAESIDSFGGNMHLRDTFPWK